MKIVVSIPDPLWHTTAAIRRRVEAVVLRRRLRRKEREHGFPCGVCGARTFSEAADLCRGDCSCPGDTMSKDIFTPQNALLQQRAEKGQNDG